MIETVGVGQSETDVAEAADTVAVIVQPGSGDALQFLKAGIMEVPDVLVVTKSDLGAPARRAEQDLRAALGALGAAAPVLAVSSLRPTAGIDALADALQAHRDGLDLAAARTRVRRLGALADFVHEHGERGLRALGGRRAARRWLERAGARARRARAPAPARGASYGVTSTTLVPSVRSPSFHTYHAAQRLRSRAASSQRSRNVRSAAGNALLRIAVEHEAILVGRGIAHRSRCAGRSAPALRCRPRGGRSSGPARAAPRRRAALFSWLTVVDGLVQRPEARRRRSTVTVQREPVDPRASRP